MLFALFFAMVAAASSPQEYLYENYAGLAPTLDCVIYQESRWVPSADTNPPYVGLAQFDYTTWMATPQGQAGMSRYDPYASIDALAYGWTHFGWRHWPVSGRICLFGY